ncbi:MAG TPA: [cytidine(C)-cytidine(C)-adenosine (A)]-adding enzyme [Myxococcaceae bacterium]|nr:[cytidine(C)-cytidine(C)-adenosine (A)]-adding enzyme [Myxococcaceae bacterium]
MSPSGHQTPPPALAAARVPAGVRQVVDRLRGAGHEAFLVGGCVRDLVAGREPGDWDVATEALPADVQRLFRKVVPTGIAHGTVTVLVPGGHVEVTTYRVEAGYTDGRRPDRVEFRRDLEEDLARRDFTINAMAYDPASKALRDPFGGVEDLQQRLVRSVGDARARFAEDGLRPLRAVRFATVLDFALDPATERAIPGALDVFRKVAPERVREEFLKLLLAPGAERGLRLLASTGLLAVAFPELEQALEKGAAARVGRVPPRVEVRLAALLEGLGGAEAVLGRLRLPTRTLEEVRVLLAHPLPAEAARWTDGGARRWAAALGRERVGDGVALARAAGREGVEDIERRLERALAGHPPLATKELALGGREVMGLLGIGPSPLVGEATRWLLEQVLEAPERNTAKELGKALLGWAAARGLKPGAPP